MTTAFEILARDGAARRGRLTTAHGVVDTPVFMPVGTAGTVKAMTSDGVAATGALDRASSLNADGETHADLDLGAMAAMGPLRVGVSVKHIRQPSFGQGDARFWKATAIARHFAANIQG